MDPLPFLLVVASAFSHAVWNVLTKNASDKEGFMWLMSATSLVTLLPVFFIIMPGLKFPRQAVIYLLVSAVAEVLYLLFLGGAYKLGDLSVVYPLARSSPLFLTVLAITFLGEKISVWGAAGILFIVSGVYTIHIQSFSSKSFLTPLKSLGERPSQLAILTALCTTIYSLSDKVGVTVAHPFIYAFWHEIFIVSLLTPVIVVRRGWKVIAHEWRNSAVQAVAAGFLMRFGYVLVLFSMSMVQVSYILALRQFSVVIGAFAGVTLLKEKHGKFRIASSIMIFIGVYILAILV